MLFGPHDAPGVHHDKILRGIVTGGAGLYWQFTNLLDYEPIFEPTLGIDFYAAPEGGLGFLIGGHAGFTPRFSSEIGLGARLPLSTTSATSNFALDGQIIFFDEGIEPQAFQTGARLALTHSWVGSSIGEEVRLVAEYRGNRRVDSISPLKPLLWVGVKQAFRSRLSLDRKR